MNTERFSEFEGDLYRHDLKPPLRKRWKYQFSKITTVAELKATLRAGSNTWPGCYPLYFITSDGCALSFESVLKNLAACFWSIRHKSNDGWRIVARDVNWEDSSLRCEQSGKPIESAYGN